MKHSQLVLFYAPQFLSGQSRDLVEKNQSFSALENVKGKEITILLYLSELGRGPRCFFSSNFISQLLLVKLRLSGIWKNRKKFEETCRKLFSEDFTGVSIVRS